MKRVLTVVRNLSIGGTQRHAVNLAVELSARGWKSDVLVLEGRGARESYLTKRRIRIIDYGCALEKYDLILAHTFLEDRRVEGIVAAAKRSGTISANINVFGRPYYNDDSIFDCHVHISRASRWRCLKRGRCLGLKPERHLVAYYSVDVDHFRLPTEHERNSAKAFLGVSADDLVWLRVGQAIDAKWDPVLIRAFSVAACVNPKLRLVLLGASKSVKARILTLNDEIKQRIVLREPTSNESELRNYYWGADVFCHAARIGESFGMVILEALLCGLPTITKIDPGRDFAQCEFIAEGATGRVLFTDGGYVSCLSQLDTTEVGRMREACSVLRDRLAQVVSIGAVTEMLLSALMDPHKVGVSSARDCDVSRDFDVLFRAQGLRFRIINYTFNTSLFYITWKLWQALKALRK